MNALNVLVPIVAVMALVFAYGLASWIGKMNEGTSRMKEIAGHIREGAMAFLKREYKAMAVFIIILFVIVGFSVSWLTAGLYVFGAVFTVLAGFFGMRVATKANVRAVGAALESDADKAFKIVFRSGAVMGLCVAGFGLFGIGLALVFLGAADAAGAITGFGLGASTMTLFGCVGGGIYKKAAGIAAGLIGKAGIGIPENDPGNPAVIADSVGGNAGDVAGTGFDLFESYAGSLIAAVVLATVTPGVVPQIGASFALTPTTGALFPLLLSVAGLIASVGGIMFVRGGRFANPAVTLKAAAYASNAIVVVCSVILSKALLDTWNCAVAVIAGLAVGGLIGKITDIYTSGGYKFIRRITAHGETGSAAAVISGFAVGMRSTVWPVICVAVGILIANAFAGLYGIALAAAGMLSTISMTVALDTFGSVSDNAGGIAKMANLPGEVRRITGKLDAAGNAAAPVGKGFAAGSAALTALALFAVYSQAVHLRSVSLVEPIIIAGLLIGAMLPFLFSALTMGSVGKAANEMIKEVRRQFSEDHGILAGTSKPDYARCVDVSTKAVLKGMVSPGLLALVAPFAVGFIMGTEALGGMLAGALVSGVPTAVMMANAGGPRLNAGGFRINAEKPADEGGYGGEAQNAVVFGDMACDPFRDAAGRSINVLIKLMAIIAVVFADVCVKVGGLI